MALHFSQQDRDRYMGQDYEDRERRRDREERFRDDEMRFGNGEDDRFRRHRGFVNRAGDEVKSWFGDDAAERRREFDDRMRSRERGYGLHIPTSEIMSRDVATVHPEDRVEHAARLMRECDCGALPVVNDVGRLVGMVTDRDIAVRLVARGLDVRTARVEDCMTDKQFACHAWDNVDDCMDSMARHQVRRMPIVDDRNRVIGIVSQSDLAHFLGGSRGIREPRAVAEVVDAISQPSSRAYR